MVSSLELKIYITFMYRDAEFDNNTSLPQYLYIILLMKHNMFLLEFEFFTKKIGESSVKE